MGNNWFSSNEGDVLVASKDGEHLFREVAANSVPVEDVPINAHVKSFQPVQAIRKPYPNRLLTVGTMSWPSNYEGVLWCLREGYEYLKAVCMDISYDIYGLHPPFSIQ